MTREEILAVRADGWSLKLSDAVATEVMGWHRHSKTARWLDQDGNEKAHWRWSPETDILAAWLVWLAVTKNHPEDWAIYSDDHGEVKVEHYPDDYKGDREEDCGDFSVGGMFPEAMCKAALLAVLSTKLPNKLPE